MEGGDASLPFFFTTGRKGAAMKRTVTLLLTFAAIVLLFAACARTPEEKTERMVKHIAHELDLNDNQKAQLNKIKDEFLARRPEMVKNRDAGFAEGVALMKSDRVDEAKLAALREKALAGTNDMVGFLFAKFTEFHDLLTPEQRAKAAEMMTKYHEDHRH